MLRAEDLMIGDLIQYNGEILRLYEFSRKYGYFGDGRPLNGILISGIEPIPLTPEILLKNGFENDFYDDVSVADYDSIRVEGYSLKGRVDGWDDFLITFCNGRVDVTTDFHGEFRGEIGYVHTFQHALRLCGINLEIKI